MSTATELVFEDEEVVIALENPDDPEGSFWTRRQRRRRPGWRIIHREKTLAEGRGYESFSEALDRVAASLAQWGCQSAADLLRYFKLSFDAVEE